jgi:hypothetical protein
MEIIIFLIDIVEIHFLYNFYIYYKGKFSKIFLLNLGQIIQWFEVNKVNRIQHKQR